MARRKAANVIKGCAWLCLAASVLPTFSTGRGPAGDATRLTLGLPWSPWMVYQEFYSPRATGQGTMFTFDTAFVPRSWSTASMFGGILLLVAARALRRADQLAPSHGGRIQSLEDLAALNDAAHALLKHTP